MDNDLMARRLVFFEIISCVFWYFMDACWMMTELPDTPADADWFVGAMFVLIALLKPVAWADVITYVVPVTLALNVAIFFFTERKFSQMAVTFAMNCWLWMNTFWMYAALAKKPELFAYGVLCFLLGDLALLAASWKTVDDQEPLTAILVRFRKFRLHIGAKEGK